LERLVPPDRSILSRLHEEGPDVLVASPVIMKRSEEVEYIKAAMALGIPTAAAVTSWDHLTTKGVFQIIPDMTLVWNQVQVEEALRLHGLARERVVATGAPVFDEWFGMKPTLGRSAFCQQAGLDPDRPYILYLCSSRSIARDETGFVADFARELRRRPGTQRLSVLVRPYPWHAQIWDGWPEDLLTIWPRGGNNPDTPDARQGYFHALYYSIGAAGINTSGFIDAAVLNKPCVTILSERYRDTQQNIAHFQHLLNAGFLETADGAAQAAEALARILLGQDDRREQRQRFVREFVRPWGLNQPAGQSMADAVEAVAQRRAANQINAILAAGREQEAVFLRAAPAN
jgi:hypothetical protein